MMGLPKTVKIKSNFIIAILIVATAGFINCNDPDKKPHEEKFGKWTSIDYQITKDGLTYYGETPPDLGVANSENAVQKRFYVLMGAENPSGSPVIVNHTYAEESGKFKRYDSFFNAVSLKDTGPAGNFNPYPVLRIDTNDKGSFSFTNINPAKISIGSDSLSHNQIWTNYFCKLPEEDLFLVNSMDVADLDHYVFLRPDFAPVDVCNDFDNRMYAIFQSTGNKYSQDLLFIGSESRPTIEETRFYIMAKLITNSKDHHRIVGMDVFRYSENASDYANVYALEVDKDGKPNFLNVFKVADDKSWSLYDTVVEHNPVDIGLYVPSEKFYSGMDSGFDIELIPANQRIFGSPNPVICVLISFKDSQEGNPSAVVQFYDAITVKSSGGIGDFNNPAIKTCAKIGYLDVDDGKSEIHVTWEDTNHVMWATVFSCR